MILYSIIFGKEFIDKFFDICLPSLLTRNNIPSVGEDVTLLIPTIQEDVNYIKSRLRDCKAGEVFGGRISVIALEADRGADDSLVSERRVAQVFSFQLLLRVMAFCIERRESFLFAAPDCIYSDGVVGSAWALHRMTGKVVSVFCGRVSPHPDDAAYYKTLIETPNGVRDEFLRSMAKLWRHTATDDATGAGVDILGHYIYRDSNKLMILTDHPNPFLGRFEPEDLDVFLEAGEIRTWDNQWEEQLFKQNRLVVQTNLDVGMMIEPDSETREQGDLDSNINQARQRHLRKMRVVESDGVTGSLLSETFMRQRRFRNVLNSFVFTSGLSGAAGAPRLPIKTTLES
jgi:hypothetical protein